MGNYSIVERRVVISYDTIEEQYISDRKYILSVTFIVLIYLKDYQKESQHIFPSL